MKQALIISCFYQDISTSRPKLVQDFLSKYYETKVLTADFVHSTKSYDYQKIRNVKKVHVPSYEKNFSIQRIISHLIFAYKSFEYIKKTKPNLVYICLPPNVAGWLAAKISKKMGIKCIVDVVDIWPNYNNDSTFGLKKIAYEIWGGFRERSLKYADAIILECNLYRKYIDQNTNVSVIPLAKKENVDFNAIDKEVETGDALYIAYLGAFSYSYDFNSLIEILVELKKNMKVHLEIIGAGERKSEIIEQLKRESIPYTDYGIVYDDIQKIKILSKCHLGYNGFVKDAVVGQSYKSLDYLSLGIPLLNSLWADTWEIVNSRNIGFNFSHENISDVVSKIVQYELVAFNHMKKRARNTFKDLYSWEVYCNNMKKILEEIGEL